MKVHTYEKAFLAAGGIVLVACLLALLYASVGMGIHLPGRAGEVDPQNVHRTPPFDRPGVRQIGPDQYEVVVVAQAWAFNPPLIRVPAQAEVTFIATTTDIIHGFYIAGTRVNMMLIPGQVARNSYRFKEPGEHLLICHEYCGLGHHAMFGKVIVEPARALGALPTAAHEAP
jgi:cytochrome c oxidase subunit 2